MAASPKKDLKRRQRRWADLAGVAHDGDYVRDLDANLRAPMSAATRAAFARGSELEPRRTMPARIAALHSSAALVANVFDYWCARDASALVAALAGRREPAEISFEEPLPTGVEGDPPLVDVMLRCASGRSIAVESKFCEWLTRRPAGSAALKPKYFPRGDRLKDRLGDSGLWSERGMPRCERLAEELRRGEQRFKYLHAAQLLKHALGIARAAPAAIELRYLYFDWPGRYGTAHREELARFAGLVGGELEFASSTYQQLYAALRGEADADASYLEYLRTRYFGAAPVA